MVKHRWGKIQLPDLFSINLKRPTNVIGVFPHLHKKGCGNVIPVKNEQISPCNFSINPLLNYCIFKKKTNEKSMRE